MKGIIIYKSKYGATKKYAGWLSEATGYDAVSVKEIDVKTLGQYDVIIMGGGVYASGIACMGFLKKVYSHIKDKKIIVYTCGASPYDERFFGQLVARNMTGELNGIPVFYCRGGFDFKNMTFGDRTLCKMLRKALSKKDPKDYEVWEAALMEVGEDESGDWTDRANLAPILEYLNTSEHNDY